MPKSDPKPKKDKPKKGEEAAATAAAEGDSACSSCGKAELFLGKTNDEWSHICMNVCGGRCCHHVAWAIESPSSKRDVELMRAAVMHPGVSFFKEDDEWFIQVKTKCSKLLPNNGCGIYLTRPQVCRDYRAGECEWPDGVEYEEKIEDDFDLQEFADRRFRKKKNPGEPINPHFRADVAVWPIDKPIDEEDVDFMRWGVLHENVAFFVEDKIWHLLIATPEARKTVSRAGWSVVIETDEQLQAWTDRWREKKRAKKERKAKKIEQPAKAG